MPFVCRIAARVALYEGSPASVASSEDQTGSTRSRVGPTSPRRPREHGHPRVGAERRVRGDAPGQVERGHEGRADSVTSLTRPSAYSRSTGTSSPVRTICIATAGGDSAVRPACLRCSPEPPTKASKIACAATHWIGFTVRHHGVSRGRHLVGDPSLEATRGSRASDPGARADRCPRLPDQHYRSGRPRARKRASSATRHP